jgi:hypothetical protein
MPLALPWDLLQAMVCHTDTSPTNGEYKSILPPIKQKMKATTIWALPCSIPSQHLGLQDYSSIKPTVGIIII